MRQRFVSPLVAACALGCGLAAAAGSAAFAAPFSFDTAFGRLPKNVVPVDYTIAITPDVAAKTTSGRESVALLVRTATGTVQFNTLDETLSNVRFDGVPVARTRTENDKQLTTVTLAHPAQPGRHTLTFAYTAKIQSAPEGLFAQPYRTPQGTDGVLLTTQFEATDARRMFPCWDEPAFRSTFALSMTVPASWNTVSNMPVAQRVVHGDVATVSFARTPKMPTYLVEFSGGDIAAVQASSGGYGFGVWAVKGQEAGGSQALANAQVILGDYNDYFGEKFPLPKLDSIAVPGGFQGAMENWGAITYNDQALLVTDSSTLGAKQNIFAIQAHEMAHQWNGDLVTMGWWDDLWLNESFASWMAAKETDKRNPSWNWLESEDGSKEGAMNADARLTSHPIQVHIADELQAQNSFDNEITYAKGQAFLQMLEAYLGPDTFRDGIRRYMQARKFSNATGTDLWNALSAASHQDVAAVAQAWVTQAGFPLVSETSSCDASGNRTVSLSQSRFLLSGTDATNPHWSVPLVIRSGANGTPTRVMLTTNGQTTPAGRCDEPLSLNAGTVGFYRVAYDADTLAVNQKNFGTLVNGDRIALLDDQWALVRAGKAKLPSYLTLASSMGSDLDARAWEQIVGSLAQIEVAERGTPGHDAFTAYARSIVKPLADQLGFDAKSDETPDVQGLRRLAIASLGAWGDRGIIAEAQKRFNAFIVDRSTIRPDDQGTILGITAAYADAATFDQLHLLAKSAKNETEQRRYYGALMGVRDTSLAMQALQIALSPEIPPQAESGRLFLIAAATPYHADLAWQTMTKNADKLLAPFGLGSAGLIAEAVPQLFERGAAPEELEAWVKTRVPAGMAPKIAQGMERVRSAARERSMFVDETDAYVTGLKTNFVAH